MQQKGPALCIWPWEAWSPSQGDSPRPHPPPLWETSRGKLSSPGIYGFQVYFPCLIFIFLIRKGRDVCLNKLTSRDEYKEKVQASSPKPRPAGRAAVGRLRNAIRKCSPGAQNFLFWAFREGITLHIVLQRTLFTYLSWKTLKITMRKSFFFFLQSEYWINLVNQSVNAIS